MTFDEEIEPLLRPANILADPYTPTIAAIMPFFHDEGGYTRREIAYTMLRVLIEAGGNFNRFYITHYAYQARLGLPPRFPSPDTIRRAIIEPRRAKKGFIKHDVHAQDVRHAKVFLAQLRAFAKDVGLQSGQFYVTLDGSPMVKYGAKAYESKRPLHEHSEVSLWSRPITRRKGDTPHPFFRGSSGGLEFLHCTIHTLDGKTSHTVYVDAAAKLDMEKATQHCMDILGEFELDPKYIVADKEFTGRGDLWEAIRDYADRRNVLAIGPKVRREVRIEMQRMWDDELFQELPSAGSRVWWAFTEGNWSKAARGRRKYGVAIAYEEVPFDFQPDDRHGTIVQPGERGVSPRVAAFTIQVNKTVKTNSQFRLVLAAIPRRWACEALFQRHGMRFGSSKSSDLLPRQLMYGLSLGALNSYGHWRAVKMNILSRPHDDATSMSWWMGDLKACVDEPDLACAVPRLLPTRARSRVCTVKGSSRGVAPEISQRTQPM